MADAKTVKLEFTPAECSAIRGSIDVKVASLKRALVKETHAGIASYMREEINALNALHTKFNV